MHERDAGFQLPAALSPGDVIQVIAPSSPFDATLAWVGLGWLARRYRVRFDRGLFARSGYLAGSDARRIAELDQALRAPDVRAVIAARGGYGASRFVADIDWSLLARSPRWLVGFSDVTALHVEAQRVGVASLHAAHVTSLGRGDARARAAFVRALEAPNAGQTFPGLRALAPGAHAGPLVGGNLTMLHATAAAGRLCLPQGCVLFLEDVTERPYRVDRMLTTLALGGHLARAGAVVLGDFTQCDPGPDRVTVEDVLVERLGGLGVPVALGVPAGHEIRNEPLVLGGRCVVRVSGGLATVATGAATA